MRIVCFLNAIAVTLNCTATAIGFYKSPICSYWMEWLSSTYSITYSPHDTRPVMWTKSENIHSQLSPCYSIAEASAIFELITGDT